MKVVQRPPEVLAKILTPRPRGPFAALHMRIRKGEYVEGGELAAALRANEGTALPVDLLDYLCLRLEGKHRKPRGRRKGKVVRQLKNLLAAARYERYLKVLKRDRTGVWTTKFCKRLKLAPGKTPPHEIAARLVTQDLFAGQSVDWRHVANQISRTKLI